MKDSNNVQMFVRHQVADYETWKKGYDHYGSQQRAGGVYYQKVYRSIDNPNEVTVIHDFHSIELAKSFANSGELKRLMKEIGAIGIPEIWFVKLC